MVKTAMHSGRRRDRDLDQRLPRAACVAPSPLATSLSVQAPPTSIVTRLQWGDASGICRDAHCAGRRGREAEGGGLLRLSRFFRPPAKFPNSLNRLLLASRASAGVGVVKFVVTFLQNFLRLADPLSESCNQIA